MRRSEFIQKIAMSLFSLPFILNAKPPATPAPLELYSGYLAGINYYSLKDVYHFLSAGQQLRILREPENAYDKLAIAIWFNEYKLGYIAKKDNQVLSKLLDGHYELIAEIASMKKDKFMPPSAVKIRVTRK